MSAAVNLDDLAERVIRQVATSADALAEHEVAMCDAQSDPKTEFLIDQCIALAFVEVGTEMIRRGGKLGREQVVQIVNDIWTDGAAEEGEDKR